MNNYGVAVWNDARQAAACEAVNEWREDVQEAGPPLTQALLDSRPAIQQECPPITTAAGTTWFGNSDIWGWSGADPT